MRFLLALALLVLPVAWADHPPSDPPMEIAGFFGPSSMTGFFGVDAGGGGGGPSGDALLLESGDFGLLEDDSFILLE